MEEAHLWADASVQFREGSAAIGFIIEDGDGERLGAFGYSLAESCDSTAAEYHAIIHGLEYLQSTATPDTVHIHSDSTSVIRVVDDEHDDMTDEPTLQGLVFRVRDRLGEFDAVELHDIASEENIAHDIATSGHPPSRVAASDD